MSKTDLTKTTLAKSTLAKSSSWSSSWRRASLAVALICALTLKLILGTAALADALAGQPDAFSGIICHSVGDDGSPADLPTPQDHRCGECCLLRAVTWDAPPLPVAFYTLRLPVDGPGLTIFGAEPPSGPPFEAWSPVQAQRGPPSAA
jgi:hypothetical protein